jgi:galactokinase
VVLLIFGKKVIFLYGQAPGRVNIIGEHVDYNDGFILPFAIDKVTKVTVKDSETDEFIITSKGFEKKIVKKDDMERTGEWTDYIKGSYGVLTSVFNLDIPPLEIEIESDVPLGAGLSSSAAIEVATLIAIAGHMGVNIDKRDLYTFAQAVEHKFVGVMCGIMDQFISVMGEKDKAVFLDTMTMEYEYVDLNLEGSAFYIINSNVKHSLDDGEYNIRREQCESALKKMVVKSFRELDLETLENKKNLLTNVEYKRSLHVLTENMRVLECKTALSTGDVKKAGELISQTHLSLRDNYECSCVEIDFLADELIKKEEIYGARIMGGGFGGSLIILANDSFKPELLDDLNTLYEKKYGVRFDTYHVKPSEGAKLVG